jgi:hypothetical protein
MNSKEAFGQAVPEWAQQLQPDGSWIIVRDSGEEA